MKIALIAENNQQRERIFPPRLIQALGGFGELVINDADNSPAHVLPLMDGADVVITSWGSPQMTSEYLDRAPNLKLILHAAGTVQPYVSEAVWQRGVRVACSTSALGRGVAETTLALTIAASKNFFQLNNYVHAGGWRDAGVDKVVDMVDITIGVVGAGMVGKHYIRLLEPFETDVVVYDPYVSQELCEQMGAEKVSFEELLKRSDIVAICVPSVPETDHMFNRETLSLMKKGAGLVNTARGSVINEADLYAHMAAGNLRFACLDVTDPEPPAQDNPLRRLGNVILLPHIAGVVNNGLGRIGRHVVRELERYCQGEPLTNEITEEMMFRVGKS